MLHIEDFPFRKAAALLDPACGPPASPERRKKPSLLHSASPQKIMGLGYENEIRERHFCFAVFWFQSHTREKKKNLQQRQQRWKLLNGSKMSLPPPSVSPSLPFPHKIKRAAGTPCCLFLKKNKKKKKRDGPIRCSALPTLPVVCPSVVWSVYRKWKKRQCVSPLARRDEARAFPIVLVIIHTAAGTKEGSAAHIKSGF